MMAPHEDCPHSPCPDEWDKAEANTFDLVHLVRRLADAELMVRAMAKYRFAVFPAWSERQYEITGDLEEAQEALWCVAGHTCHTSESGVPVLSKEAREGLEALMGDAIDHERPGFWRRLFLKLIR